MRLIINIVCAYITVLLTYHSRAAGVLKPDLETVLPVNQNGHWRYSQQSSMNNRVVGKEGLLILSETVTFYVNS